MSVSANVSLLNDAHMHYTFILMGIDNESMLRRCNGSAGNKPSAPFCPPLRPFTTEVPQIGDGFVQSLKNFNLSVRQGNI